MKKLFLLLVVGIICVSTAFAFDTRISVQYVPYTIERATTPTESKNSIKDKDFGLVVDASGELTDRVAFGAEVTYANYTFKSVYEHQTQTCDTNDLFVLANVESVLEYKENIQFRVGAGLGLNLETIGGVTKPFPAAGVKASLNITRNNIGAIFQIAGKGTIQGKGYYCGFFVPSLGLTYTF